MTAVNIDQRSARSYWTINRDHSERAFRLARRHSALVRFLRIALPLVIVLAAVGITLKTYLNPLFNPLPIQVGNVILSGTRITMDHPRIDGFTHDARPYALTAEKAIQDLRKPDSVELHNVEANVQMQDLGKLQLTAPLGFYNTKKELLKLEQNILITSTKGYEGRLKEATVDIGRGHVTSNHPVEMRMLQGTLDANRMEIINSGDLIRFDHGVRMTITQPLSHPSGKTASSAAVANHQGSVATPQPTDKTLPQATPTNVADPAPPPTTALSQPAPKIVYTFLRRLPPHDPRRATQNHPVTAAKTVLIEFPERRPRNFVGR